ncbi:MAG: autotransporter domain-containing protein [Planctomycetia bacterium]|nr:autotransporter domain-containing protein [Planctomycetia bacterium]
MKNPKNQQSGRILFGFGTKLNFAGRKLFWRRSQGQEDAMGVERRPRLLLRTCLLALAASGAARLSGETLAANFNVGTLNVTTFEQDVTFNGNPVPLQPTDTITMSGGTMTVTGGGNAYSALLGTGSGVKSGFLWGTGGTINLSNDVTLSINVASGTYVPLTQSGGGTLDLTSTSTQNFVLTQNAGTLITGGSVVTRGDVLINGTANIGGDFTTNDITGEDDYLTVNGTLAIAGEYIDNADQTDVIGRLTAQTANFQDGGLKVETGGEFIVTGNAFFSSGTAIINDGDMEVGANSQLDSTTVTDRGTMVLGDGTIFTGNLGTSGVVTAKGDVDFFRVFNSGDIDVEGDATFGAEFSSTSGTINLNQTATFEDTVVLSGGTQVNIAQTADFENTLTLTGGSEVNAGDNINSTSNIGLTNSTLISGGNIVTTQGVTTAGNSVIGLSTRLEGADKGNLTAGTSINLSSGTRMETDFSGLEASSTPTLLVQMTSGTSTNNFLIDGATTDVNAVAALFGTTTVLREIYASDNGSGYNIYGRVQSLGDYAQDEGLLPPAVDAGNAVDDLINNTTPSDPAYDMVDDLLNQTDKDAINQTLYNLAGGYGVENIFSMTLVNLGQAGSPFFQGMATGLPQKKNPCWPSLMYDDLVGRDKRVELWGAPFYQSLEAGGNFFQPGFNVHEAGFMVGARQHYTARATGGIMFAYGAPRLNQSGGLAGYDAQFHSDIKLDDYQLAGHFEYETASEFCFSLFVGGGSQRLRVNRNAFGFASNETEMNRNFTGSTDGNTLSVTAYLMRPICLHNNFIFSPMVGIDCMYAWLYSFSETSTGTGDWQDMTNLSEGNFYSPVSYGKTQYERISARAGFRGEYRTIQGGLAFQAFYGTQLGGEDYAVMPVSSLGGALNNRLYGYEIGRDSLNLGGGLWQHLNAARTITASAQYNYFTLTNASAANVTAALVWRY